MSAILLPANAPNQDSMSDMKIYAVQVFEVLFMNTMRIKSLHFRVDSEIQAFLLAIIIVAQSYKFILP